MDTLQGFGGFLAGVPWAKIAYSVILGFLILLLGAETYRVWFDRTLFVGRFEYFDGATKSGDKADTFSAQIIQQHRLLLALFASEYERGEAARRAEKSASGAGSSAAKPQSVQFRPLITPLGDPKSFLSDVEISVQGINVKQILATLRRSVSTPNEVTGMVNAAADGVYVSVTWPNGPHFAKVFQLPTQADGSAAAFHVACSVIWAQARDRQAEYEQVGRQEFCDWTDAWRLYDLARSRSQTARGLAEEDKKLLLKARSLVDRLVAAKSAYAEVYRLRSDIINLTPDASDDDKKIAQSDIAEYGRRLEKSQGLAGQAGATAAGAGTITTDQPTLAVQKSGLEVIAGLPPSAEKTKSTVDIVKSASPSVARVFSSQTSSTGFVVGPDLLMVPSFAVVPKLPMSVAFEEDQAGRVYPVGEIVASNERLKVALIRVPGIDVRAHPALRLRPPNDPRPTVGEEVIVIGYGLSGGFKQLAMLGGIVAADSDDLRYNAGTQPGSSGAPVISRASGDVIAMHWGATTAQERMGIGTKASSILSLPDFRVRLGEK